MSAPLHALTLWPESRTCTKCGTEKPLTEYFKQPGGKYGKKSACKACCKAYAQEKGPAYRRRPEYRQRARIYKQRHLSKPGAREVRREQGREYARSPEILERYRISYHLNKQKFRARVAVRTAITRGDLVRTETCQRCGIAPGRDRRGRALIRAHHHLGYAPEHRLDVEWVCPCCDQKAEGLARRTA